MAAVQSDGTILHFGASKLNAEIDEHKLNKNNLYTCDYNCDGSRLVVGGLDRILYVYDEIANSHTFLRQMSDKDE